MSRFDWVGWLATGVFLVSYYQDAAGAAAGAGRRHGCGALYGVLIHSLRDRRNISGLVHRVVY